MALNVVVAYDVRDDGRRARLAAVLAAHGIRIQRSVFECLLDESTLAEILQSADRLLNNDHDTVHVFTSARRAGRSRTPPARSAAPFMSCIGWFEPGADWRVRAISCVHLLSRPNAAKSPPVVPIEVLLQGLVCKRVAKALVEGLI